MHKDNLFVDEAKITKTPELAFYKYGKVLNALSAAFSSGTIEKKERMTKLFDSQNEQQVGMADGLQKYVESLALSEITLNDFNAAIQEIEKDGLPLSFQSINEKLGSNPAWQSYFEVESDVDLEKFLESRMFVNDQE